LISGGKLAAAGSVIRQVVCWRLIIVLHYSLTLAQAFNDKEVKVLLSPPPKKNKSKKGTNVIALIIISSFGDIEKKGF